jgi:hypothetical protein
MIYFRPYKKGDENFETIEPVEGWSDEFAQAVEDSRLAVTGVWNNQVVGCGGTHPNGEQGELWLRLSRWCLDHPVESLRCVIEAVKIIEQTCPFRQLNAVVKNGFCTERIIRKLGYTDVQLKDDYTIYAKRIRE